MHFGRTCYETQSRRWATPGKHRGHTSFIQKAEEALILPHGLCNFFYDQLSSFESDALHRVFDFVH